MSAGDKRLPKGKSVAGAEKVLQRRAEALRANLKRRKAQQRDRAGTGKATSDQE